MSLDTLTIQFSKYQDGNRCLLLNRSLSSEEESRGHMNCLNEEGKTVYFQTQRPPHPYPSDFDFQTASPQLRYAMEVAKNTATYAQAVFPVSSNFITSATVDKLQNKEVFQDFNRYEEFSTKFEEIRYDENVGLLELMKKRVGNCKEMAELGYIYLDHYFPAVRKTMIESEEHVAIALRKNNGDSDRVICDPWRGVCYPAPDVANSPYFLSFTDDQIHSPDGAIYPVYDPACQSDHFKWGNKQFKPSDETIQRVKKAHFTANNNS
jgi:hypothetical protein